MKKVLHSVDLFAGCGGLSRGLEMAGFSTLLYSEINKDASATYRHNLNRPDLQGVGDIAELSNTVIKKLKSEWKARGVEDIDLVAGGPPCQGYSGIGHRRSYAVERSDIPSNYLFQEMVRVVKAIRPRMFLFENVRGLLAGRWTVRGEKGEIWRDVRETFAAIKGYQIGWRVVQAKWYGVPQNRPRVILVGVRDDLSIKLGEDHWDDVEDNPRGLLPEPLGVTAPDLIDVLGDLDDPDFESKAASERYMFEPRNPFQQLMRSDRRGRPLPVDAPVTEHEFSKHSPRVREKFEHMLANGGAIPTHLQTKKFAQRVLPARWNGEGPTITATSLPDDFVHYRRPRILTVREWARLQMFPDWWTFMGPRTTGGLRRAGVPTEGIWEREVPKYTQIGNAVPVGLANAVGKHLAAILKNA